MSDTATAMNRPPFGSGILSALITMFCMPALAEVIVLETSRVCEITINGVKLRGAALIGHRQDLRTLLKRVASVTYHDCDFLLIAPRGVDEADWIIQRKTRALSRTEPFTTLRSHVVLVRTDIPEFAALYRASASAQGSGGGKPPSPPTTTNGHQAQKGGGSPAAGAKCGQVEEICLSRDGEASFELANDAPRDPQAAYVIAPARIPAQ